MGSGTHPILGVWTARSQQSKPVQQVAQVAFIFAAAALIIKTVKQSR